jgi:predicted RNase H-like HicB family nuclease
MRFEIRKPQDRRDASCSDRGPAAAKRNSGYHAGVGFEGGVVGRVCSSRIARRFIRNAPVQWMGKMSNTYTAIFERDGDWHIAYCPEIPGANGQGRTKEEARESLAAAIALILQDRREDALRGLPDDAERETVTVV